MELVKGEKQEIEKISVCHLEFLYIRMIIDLTGRMKTIGIEQADYPVVLFLRVLISNF